MREMRWTLQELIDFEVQASENATSSSELLEEIRALEGDPLMRKRNGLLLWTRHGKSYDEASIGKKFLASLAMITLGFALVSLLSSAAAAWGSKAQDGRGFHVLVFLCIALFLPWLIFLCGILVMTFRRHLTPLSFLGSWMIGRVTKSLRMSDALRNSLLDHGKILGWRISQQLQWVAICYHLGAALGLLALVFFRDVAFVWESTTPDAMQRFLETLVRVLSAPWAHVLPQAVPDVAQSRWQAGTVPSPSSNHAWWHFLLLALMIWGVLPRLMLMFFSRHKESSLLEKMAFAAPHHRKLWRAIDGVRREDVSTAPADGALVIDVGGIAPNHEKLRPFLLQHLRVNPIAWHRTDVLDLQQTQTLQDAIRQAPAGIVLLVEAAALAPRLMITLLGKIRNLHNDNRVIILCLADETQQQEREQWSDFADGLVDQHLELYFHTPPP